MAPKIVKIKGVRNQKNYEISVFTLFCIGLFTLLIPFFVKKDNVNKVSVLN